MRICLQNVLSKKQIEEIKALRAEETVISGAITAGARAKKVKKNLQLPTGSEIAALIRQKTIAALEGHAVFANYALVKKFGPILYARYEKGMRYGLHADNVILQAEGVSIRSDLSFTLWLTAPESYEGGALKIHGHDEDCEYKLHAGDAIVYPSDSLHEVTEVTRGTREVIVGWAQSRVRETDLRAALFDIQTLKNTPNLDSDTLALRLSHLYGRFYRRFAEA